MDTHLWEKGIQVILLRFLTFDIDIWGVKEEKDKIWEGRRTYGRIGEELER